MLAGMLHADPLAMMAKHVFIKRPDEVKLHRKSRRPLKRPAGEVARDLPWKPRPALSAPTDHDSVRAGARECGAGVVAGPDTPLHPPPHPHPPPPHPPRRPLGPALLRF